MEIGRPASFLYRISIANTKSLCANFYTGLFRSCFLTRRIGFKCTSRDSTYKGVSKINSVLQRSINLFVLHMLVVYVSDSGKTPVILAIGAHSSAHFPLKKTGQKTQVSLFQLKLGVHLSCLS